MSGPRGARDLRRAKASGVVVPDSGGWQAAGPRGGVRLGEHVQGGRRGEAGASPRWGMSAFWLYDPRGGHNPRLQGFRLAEGRSWRLPPECRNESLLAVKSPLLGLELHLDGRWLHLWDPVVEDYRRTCKRIGARTAGGTSLRVRGAGGSASASSARRRGSRESGRSPRRRVRSTGC